MKLILTIIRFTLAFYLFTYCLIHLVLLIAPSTINFFIFNNWFNRPVSSDYLKNPTKLNLRNVHNFYLNVEPQVKVGIWHFIPSPLKYNYEKHANKTLKEHFDRYFRIDDRKPIVIYIHGTTKDRSDQSRIDLCNSITGILSYHVFSIDYRGHGDSSGEPSEKGVCNDVINLYNFIKTYRRQSRIFLWGHGLGAGIATHVSKILTEFKSPPSGLILEAPFKNLKYFMDNQFLSKLFFNNPFINKLKDEALESLGLSFSNDENLIQSNSKVLIFHSEDDPIIDSEQSRKLVEVCNKKRPDNYPPVKLVELDGKFKLGHDGIHTHQDIYSIIKNFI